jgi:hypothetical protein
MAFNGVETGEMGEQQSTLESELEAKLLDVSTNGGGIIALLARHGRNVDSEKLGDVVAEHLRMLRQYREQGIDDVRLKDDAKFAAEEILRWSMPR